MSIDPATVAVLRTHHRQQVEERLAWGSDYRDNGLVFAMENGDPINSETFSDAFARHAKAAGLPRIRLHDVRHSAATAALAAGIPAKVVSERLGHSGIAITLDRYSHVLPSMDQQAASDVENLIDGTA
jgi:integrase